MAINKNQLVHSEQGWVLLLPNHKKTDLMSNVFDSHDVFAPIGISINGNPANISKMLTHFPQNLSYFL